MTQVRDTSHTTSATMEGGTAVTDIIFARGPNNWPLQQDRLKEFDTAEALTKICIHTSEMYSHKKEEIRDGQNKRGRFLCPLSTRTPRSNIPPPINHSKG